MFHKEDKCYAPASKGSRKVANLTERKNPQPPYMVSKNLSVFFAFLPCATSKIGEMGLFRQCF